MAENKNNLNIPAEKFGFVNEGERLRDKKFDDKPIGYLKDAWIRFRKSKASVVAAIIILAIILYAFLAPVFITSHSSTFMDSNYAKKAPRHTAVRDWGILHGGMTRDFSEKGLIKAVAIGMAAEDANGEGVTWDVGMNSEYQPMLKIGEGYLTKSSGK